MSRLRKRFDVNASAGRTTLVIYLTQGDPSPAATGDIVRAVAGAGADVIELGVPFSDPNADGPEIQAAMERALAAGGGLSGALATVAELRDTGCDVPIMLFGYYNPMFVRGPDRFAADAKAAGVDAVLTVDVPIDELAELRDPLAAAGVGVVPLVAPTSGDERIAKLRAIDAPFVYYIAKTGVTGSAFAGASGGAERVAKIRELSGSPVAVGFGIKTPDDARSVGAYADGVVVGSAVVQAIAGAGQAGAARAAGDLVAKLRAGLDRGE